MSGIALILAGHGSHISANTAGVVWRYVDRLRKLGVAYEVTACFWKEAPAFSQVLDTVTADDIVIVPLFTATGYFTQQVLPSEMGLNGALTRRGNRRIHLTPTLGEHKLLDSIVDQRLRHTLDRFELSPDETAIAIIGHGTRRNQQSRHTAGQQAARIRDQGFASEVVAVYLDDEPAIASVYQTTRSPNIIALPYFLADGSHVGSDLPRALGISGSGKAERVKGRAVYYSAPVGADASICDVILELARDTGLPFATRSVGSAWAAFPSAGKRALCQALESGLTLRFGQVSVSRERVSHCDEAGATRAITSPAALRKLVREDPFRPLSTSHDLPAGWHVDLAQPQDAHAVLETVYPGLVADWAARKAGRLMPEPLEITAKRQLGMFKDIQQLTAAIFEKTISKVCDKCVRQPSWWSNPPAVENALPCRSACNLWLSTARKTGELL